MIVSDNLPLHSAFPSTTNQTKNQIMNNTLHIWQISFGNIVDQNKKTICFLPERKNNDTAHLISAAPDLLSALEAAVARVQIANEEGDPILSAWLPDALSAIAKAKGAA
jgi:peptidase E